MRILILNHNDQSKGTFFRCFFLGKELCQNGNEVELSCLNPARDTMRTKTIQIEGVLVHLLVGQRGSSSLTELPLHVLRSIINTRLAMSGKFDVIYSFNGASLTTGLSVIFLKLFKTIGFFNAKLIVDWDDWWGHGGLASIDKKGWVVRTIATFLEIKVPLLADKVTVVSDVLRVRALQVGVKVQNIFYLPNGANLGSSCLAESNSLREELGLPLGMNILCYVGRALTTFGCLVYSVSQVVEKKPNTVMVFIAPLNAVHIQLIKDAGILLGNVMCVGVQPHERLLRYLRASDILLLPRADNNSDRSNYPARLGDYMAAGRPIVATAIGEAKNVLTKNRCGLLAKPNDPVDFADKILKLLDDLQLREDMGSRGYAAICQKLSWQIIAKHLHQDVLSK